MPPDLWLLIARELHAHGWPPDAAGLVVCGSCTDGEHGPEDCMAAVFAGRSWRCDCGCPKRPDLTLPVFCEREAS
jgi:hypothetical protein